jgi:hypothetical protein
MKVRPDVGASLAAVENVTQGVTQERNRQAGFSAKCLILLVPVERIELPTFGLQNRCSTAELNRLKALIVSPIVFGDGSSVARNHSIGRRAFEWPL